jgi:signal peptidase I (EC:3.4.21.89). Serine peptidase. MEROPS family S26A
MIPTLKVGNCLFGNKFYYGIPIPFTDKKLPIKIREPKRGDVIIFRYPANPKIDFVKRCIGMPGEKLEIRNKIVYINDKELKEPYVIHTSGVNVGPPRDEFGPIIIPKDCYFMMGDNRDNSNDSRFWGVVEKKYIKAKVIFIWWPIWKLRIFR